VVGQYSMNGPGSAERAGRRRVRWRQDRPPALAGIAPRVADCGRAAGWPDRDPVTESQLAPTVGRSRLHNPDARAGPLSSLPGHDRLRRTAARTASMGSDTYAARQVGMSRVGCVASTRQSAGVAGCSRARAGRVDTR
jgi:hypothetical protein